MCSSATETGRERERERKRRREREREGVGARSSTYVWIPREHEARIISDGKAETWPSVERNMAEGAWLKRTTMPGTVERSPRSIFAGKLDCHRCSLRHSVCLSLRLSLSLSYSLSLSLSFSFPLFVLCWYSIPSRITSDIARQVRRKVRSALERSKSRADTGQRKLIKRLCMPVVRLAHLNWNWNAEAEADPANIMRIIWDPGWHSRSGKTSI